MKHARCFYLAVMLAASIALDATADPTAPQSSDQPATSAASASTGSAQRQDGRFIPRLRWVAPHGELPGTYAEYLLRHPLTPARFADRHLFAPTRKLPAPLGRAAEHLAILVNSTLYPGIRDSLSQYAADLASEGYTVYVETVAGGAPEDIKDWIQERYAFGCTGVVFIGDIAAAWAEVSGDVFPCDLFYMDLDGHWQDADHDGDYEIHTAGIGDEGPELYVARLYTHALDYGAEADLISQYFAKAHAYRAGTLTQPWRGLEYLDKDWFDMEVNLDQIYGTNVVRHDYGRYTTAADYLDQMDLGQHFVQVCAHSYSGGHHFSTAPTESASYAHVYVYSPTTRDAYLLLGSDDGIKAWLNHELVCTHDVYQEWAPDQFFHAVTLNEGWNQLLCKISQEGGDYRFSARFTDPLLATMPDLVYQLSDPDTHSDEPQFIRRWLVNGFHQDDPDNFWSYLTTSYLGGPEYDVNPSAGQVMGGQIWTEYFTDGAYVDLDLYGGELDYGVTYAFARVYAKTPIVCQLWLGYDDGARVWLNGDEIVYDSRYGDFTPDMKKVYVDLLSGENRLLVKVSEWAGRHGFSARFAYADGSAVSGLTYDPEPEPISYICTWLMNGPYVNPDLGTRLSQDYLGDEAGVRPSVGEVAAQGSWEAGASGIPFDIAAFYDRDGGWVLSETIQQRDPPVLFYNLFACGPGRFTDDNYLAGAYIFNTTYGLITVASAKSGSMLNFVDFTTPLGQGCTIGEAYRQWFEVQAPFELWEREWYYGMVLNGDPTLRPVRKGDLDRDGRIDLDDYAALCDCLAGPDTPPSPDQPGLTIEVCLRAFDFDSDEDVDTVDFEAFQWSFTGSYEKGSSPP